MGQAMHFKITATLALLSAMHMASPAMAQIDIPTNLVVRAPLTTAGGNLRGEYWKLPPVSIPGDGATNPTNRIDNLINGFGQPDGTFSAKSFVYLGNDLTHVTNWLGADAATFVGETNNLDEGVFRFTGFINVTNASTVNLGTTSDDGSRITIGGIDIINNDGSHGDVTMDTNVVFSTAGVYPIEITYFNGDWTSDGTGTNLNHSGSTDPALHGGANFHLRVGGADVNTNSVGIFYSAAGAVVVPETLSVSDPLTQANGTLSGEYWKRPPVSIPLDGATNPTNRIDVLLGTFGPPTGTFQAKQLVYLGNDLTLVTNWLAADASSFVGTATNLDEGAFRFKGFINVTNSGTVSLGTTSDDGSRITIGGIDIVNNDGSHGDATVDTNVFFSAAGLYPIEITYFNGDWTSDGTGTNLNHSGSTDPALHGGANFHLRVAGADFSTNNAGLFSSTGPAIVVPGKLAVAPPFAVPPARTNGGSSLFGEYWKRPPVSIPLDGATNPNNRIDVLVDTFGSPTGTFQANSLVYLGNDLTSITDWLGSDAGSYVGTVDNLDEGAFRFTGMLNVAVPGTVSLGTTSDDGSRITIGGIDIINNDGSHGDVTMDTNVVFAAAGLYPIEVTYFNGDWTSDGTGTNLNHSGSTDPSLHGGANFHLRVAGADVSTNNVSLFYGPAAPVIPPASPLLLDFQFDEGQGTNTIDAANGLIGIAGVGMAHDPTNVPVTVTNSPSGAAGDLAVSLNAGSATNLAGLVVNDIDGPILAFPTNAPFTMETWVNRETGDTRQYEGLGAYGFSYKMGFNNGEFLFTLFGIIDIPSGVVIPTGEWHHVAAVWQPGTGVEMFVDGTSVTNIAETQVPRAYVNNVLTIGAENVGPAGLQQSFQGMIDRFRIHAAALTAGDLDSVADAPKAVLPSTLVAYEFNEANYPFASAGAVVRPAVANPTPEWTSDTPSGAEGDFALSFSRGTQVIVPDPDTKVQLDPTDPDFTMQAWLKFEGNPAERQVFYFNRGLGGALSFSVNTDRTLFVTTLGVKDQNSTAAVPDDGSWHHVAVVHENGKEFRFYVDATLADTQPYTGGVLFGGGNRTNTVVHLGSEGNYGLQYTGLLDRLIVTKGMLTPEEFDYPSGGTTPSVSVERTADGLSITFEGTLESADVITGPWTAVQGASPLLVTPTGDAKFYRARQ